MYLDLDPLEAEEAAEDDMMMDALGVLGRDDNLDHPLHAAPATPGGLDDPFHNLDAPGHAAPPTPEAAPLALDSPGNLFLGVR